jgi:hypothetical protein
MNDKLRRSWLALRYGMCNMDVLKQLSLVHVDVIHCLPTRTFMFVPAKINIFLVIHILILLQQIRLLWQEQFYWER